MIKTFGEFVREQRLALGMTLREFCKNFNYDPGYISRIENGLFLPPADEVKLTKLAFALKINEDNDLMTRFTDLAAISRKEVPKDIDSRVLQFLPAFFRKASKKDLTEEDVAKLIENIKGNQEE